MSKYKRKVSAAQRDKFAINIAKILKQRGVLSKQAKLHSGSYISRSVLKRVQELQHLASRDYAAVKVSHETARIARETGYQVVRGNRVVTPSDKAFIARLRKGAITGLRPVKGGFMSEVTIPFTADNVSDLVNRLLTTDLDGLKLPNEHFAFSIGSSGAGPGSNMSFRAFQTTEQMRQYFEYYDPNLEAAEIKFFRLHPEDISEFIIPKNRRKYNRKRRDRRDVESYRDKVIRTNPGKAERMRQEAAARAARHRQLITGDADRLAAYKEKAKARASKSRAKRKDTRGSK